jgi:hypothetical protein
MQQAALADSCLARDKNHSSLTRSGEREMILQNRKFDTAARIRR